MRGPTKNALATEAARAFLVRAGRGGGAADQALRVVFLATGATWSMTDDSVV